MSSWQLQLGGAKLTKVGLVVFFLDFAFLAPMPQIVVMLGFILCSSLRLSVV